jgi:hypothetical protein
MNGADVLAIANTRLGETYHRGARAVLSNEKHHGPWDCAEFASWCAFQTYGFVFGAFGTDPETADPYSGKWYSDAMDQNASVSIDEALGTPGAILIRKPGDLHIKIGHVAISLGNGSTIEARSAKYGIGIFSGAATRPWSIGCLLPGVTYSAGSIPHAPDIGILRLVKPYLKGAAVTKVQERLRDLGFGLDPDGVYGPRTEAAVLNFQAMEGLTYDGEVGRDTAAALNLGWPIA